MTFTTKGGKTFDPTTLISLAKYQWSASGDKGTYNKQWFSTAADTVRSSFGITNYGKDMPLSDSFDYNKVDWGDVYDTLSSWQTDANATQAQKSVAAQFIPMMDSYGMKQDRSIYRPYELKAQGEQIQAQGELDAAKAEAQAQLNAPGHANTIAFYEQAKTTAVESLTQQADLLKKQAQADYESGRGQVEADYAGVEDSIMASVAKLQRMSGDEFAARGMAFSGALNQAVADIAAAGASELAKAMAQKGAQLGKLTQDLVKYTAQVDLDVLNNKTQAVMEYGLQMAALLDEDATTRAQAQAVLDGLEVKQQTLNKIAPINEELAQTQAEQDYATSKAEAAQTSFENSLKLSQLGLDERKQSLAEQEAQAKYQLAYDELDLDKQKLVLDEMYKNGLLSISEYNAVTNRMNAEKSGSGSEGASVPDFTFSNAQTIISDYTELADRISGFAQDPTDKTKWKREGYDKNGVMVPETINDADYQQLKTRLAEMEPRYEKAVKLQNIISGAQLTGDALTNVQSFINKVMLATRGVGEEAYAEALLNTPYKDGTLRDYLTDAELEAITDFFGE